jgi:putative transposase
MSLVGGSPTTIPTGGTCTVRVRLLPNGAQERRLRRLAELFAECWNGVNFEGRRRFFTKQGIDLKGTYRRYYDAYKPMVC